MRRLHDWKAIQQYHDEGHGFVACRKKFGFTHAAWNKAIQRGELQVTPRPFKDRRRRYDWGAIQAYYELGHSYRGCRRKFGFSPAAWEKARQRGEIRTRPFKGMPIAQLLTGPRQRAHVKIRLLHAGLLTNQCSRCGIIEWRGLPLSMHLDHINGVRDDHRLENLRMLCPNCHSQTETYGGRNSKRRRRLQDEAPAV